MSLFIVERYLPGVDAAEVAKEADRLRTAAGLSGDVRFLGAAFVAEDESCFCRFEATSLEAVERVCREAGVPFARIVEAQTLAADDKEESWASSH